MGQFDWTPDEYLERIRARIPRYDELQEQAVAAIPFPPERVLELGMGTGETTRRLIEAHPDAWVIGLDSSPDMVFRARQTYDDVQLARMEDPLPDGPWDLVISVLSVGDLDDTQQTGPVPARPRALPVARDRRRLRARRAGEARRVVRRRGRLGGRASWPWSARRIEEGPGARPRGLYFFAIQSRPASSAPPKKLSEDGCPALPRYHAPTHGRPEEENLERPPRQAARQPQGRQGAPQQLSALPQPAPAASRLPDLRHLRGP